MYKQSLFDQAILCKQPSVSFFKIVQIIHFIIYIEKVIQKRYCVANITSNGSENINFIYAKAGYM